MAAILAACHDDDRPFLLYLALAGPRLGEALALHADDLDMAEQTARIWRQVDTSTAETRYFPLKGAARMGDLTRTVPLADALRDSIERLLDPRHGGQGRQPSGPVFLTRRGLPYSRGSVDALVERTARAAGVVFSPHALRHYFGASLISRGVPVTQVAGWMGHSSPRTTLNVYAYCMPRDDETGRAALRDTASTIIPDVRPMCASDDRAEPR